MASTAPSYWCYNCNSVVRVRGGDCILCLDCGAGFVEEMNPHRRSHRHRRHHHHQFPASPENPEPEPILRPRRNRRNGTTGGSHFNPFVVLRRSEERGTYELFYDYGSGSGLRPLPHSMSESLMGSGFNRILEHFIQLDINGFSHPPASKAAIDSLPTIKINFSHVVTDSHCAVCKEPFELNTKAREMPCNHIYHSDCILPWLAIRNSCPVCRHELPPDVAGLLGLSDDDSMGLTIWRQPGGGYAVGRFTGGGRGVAESELPVVYTGMDDAFNVNGGPRRVAWSRSENRTRGRSGVGHALHNFMSFLERFRISSSRFNMEFGFRRSHSHSHSVRLSHRNTHSRAVEV